MITKDELLKAGFTLTPESDLFNTDHFYWFHKRLVVRLNEERGTARVVGTDEEISGVKTLLEICRQYCLESIKSLSDEIADIKKELDCKIDILFELTDAYRSFE